MHCVKNEGFQKYQATCDPATWTGNWVVFDNERCDWSGHTYQWPVSAGWDATYSLSFGARSVQYLDNHGYFQFGSPGPKDGGY